MTDRVLEIKAVRRLAEQATKLAGTVATATSPSAATRPTLQLVPLRKDLAAARSAVTEAEARHPRRRWRPARPGPAADHREGAASTGPGPGSVTSSSRSSTRRSPPPG